jgi:hypothetical protein
LFVVFFIFFVFRPLLFSNGRFFFLRRKKKQKEREKGVQMFPRHRVLDDHVHVFIDNDVCGTGKVVVIAYRPASRWYQERFGKKVVGPWCLLSSALCIGVGAFVCRGESNDAPATKQKNALAKVAIGAGLSLGVVGLYKLFYDSYPHDYARNIEEGRCDVRLSLQHGADALRRTVDRHQARSGSGKSSNSSSSSFVDVGTATATVASSVSSATSPLTDLLTPMEWGELLQQYCSAADRIDDGSSLSCLSDAFRAGAVSQMRLECYGKLAAQSKSSARQRAADEREANAMFEHHTLPLASKRKARHNDAMQDYEKQAAVMALRDAQVAHRERLAQIGAEREREVERAQRAYDARVGGQRPEDDARPENEVAAAPPQVDSAEQRRRRRDAEQVRQREVAQVDEVCRLKRETAALVFASQQQKYEPGRLQAEQRREMVCRAADEEYARAIEPYELQRDESLAALRASYRRHQQRIDQQLRQEDKPRVDRADADARFQPSLVSIHSSIGDPLATTIRRTLEAEFNA